MAKRLIRMELPDDAGSLFIRLPNVMEQIQFDRESNWYSSENQYEENGQKLVDVYKRVVTAIPAAAAFVDKIESERFKSWSEIIDDPINTSVVTDIVLMLGRRKLTEDEKKLLIQPP